MLLSRRRPFRPAGPAILTGDGPDPDDDDAGGSPAGGTLVITLGADAGRLDKALAGSPEAAAAHLSRERVRRLIEAGRVVLDGAPVRDPSARAAAGAYQLNVPPPALLDLAPQDLGLCVLWEDGDLLVVDKPAGMAAHPGPGTPDGTLVNALLHHVGPGLLSVGGMERPGIVHRLDKDTSGVMVAAKTDRAHQGLSALFAAHTIERRYLALTRGAPEPAHGVVATRIGRSPHDRKKMAVLRSGGREAVTRYGVERTFGPAGRPVAARVVCELETGRTHQIRVHLASKGAPCLGDPLYGSGAAAAAVRAAIAQAGLRRQALHAAVLGFAHPVTGERLRFETPAPADMASLETYLAGQEF